jgi:hypothetical protein
MMYCDVDGCDGKIEMKELIFWDGHHRRIRVIQVCSKCNTQKV